MKSIVLITNPGLGGKAGTVYVQDDEPVTPATVLREFGDEIEDGALVTILYLETFGNRGSADQYIADTETSEAVCLRSNDTISYWSPLYEVGGVIAELEPDVELETFTVFGTNDEDNPFTAVITCDPDKVEEAAQNAGATSQTYAYLVTVVGILKGDQTDSVVS